MPQPNRYEQQFLTALKAVFIGTEVEGDSGYINLMRIKARYFEEGVFSQLRRDIDAACFSAVHPPAWSRRIGSWSGC